MKKFILCADGFGKSKDYNRAVLNGYNNGFLKSASIIANGEAFDAAVNEIIPECQPLSVGIQLNITEGKSITKCPLITDANGDFTVKPSALPKLLKNPDVLKEIEQEFRAQIEKVKSGLKVYHINSIDNIHYIPEVCSLVTELAAEYEIPYVRSLKEELVFIPSAKHILKLLNFGNVSNFFKFNSNFKVNSRYISRQNLKTNDYVVGVLYREDIDAKVLEASLKTINDDNNSDVIVEAVISPCSYLRNINDKHSAEFKVTQDKVLEDVIRRMGYEITSHKNV